MKIILHAYHNSETITRLKNLVEEQMPEVQMILTESQQQLHEKLCRPLNNCSVLITLLDNSENVKALLTLKPLFETMKLILVVHKNVNDISEPFILLEPTYTMFSDNNFMDIISVLKRIQQKQNQSFNLFKISEATSS
jgi:hypothetical protein